jgi:hypothetical protein
VITLSGLFIYFSESLRLDRSIGYILTLSLRSYRLNSILLLIFNLLKGLLNVFDIKKPENFLSGSDIPRNVLHVLNPPLYRLIRAFFTP